MIDNIVQLSPDKIKFSTIDDALAALQSGGFVVVADDEGRENEGDLVCAASLTTPAMVNFMAREARGLICVALTADRAKQLDLHPMVTNNTDPHQTAFTISVDAGPEFGVTTGISASDRATTIQRLVSDNAVPKDFRRPGHIFPLVAQDGAVLRRVGHTEAAIDLTRLAGLPEMGVICEIMNDDGSMARRDDLVNFAKKHNFPFITIAQLIAYRMERERFVVRKITTQLETRYGEFTAIGYTDMLNGVEHLALVKGSIDELRSGTPLVRVQQENLILDMLGHAEDPAVQNLAHAMTYIESQGSGVVVYLRSSSGSANGLLGTLKSHSDLITQDPDRSAMAAMNNDLREYGVGAQILNDLGVNRFRMITNTPKKMVALRGYGLEVVDTVPLPNVKTANRFDFSQPAPAPKAPVQTQAPAAAAPAKAPVAPKAEVKKEEPLVAKKADAATTAPAKPVAANDKKEVKAEAKPMTMRMGGQILSNQIMFEG
jgi:3,4-dihydroxy 2-butanone 4-phosphate synthase/GTP cyclohydrolase II